MTALQQLAYRTIQTLPDDLIVELLDFVEFLKSASSEETFLWEQVEEAHQYRCQHPEDVITVTVDEWLADTAMPETSNGIPSSL